MQNYQQKQNWKMHSLHCGQLILRKISKIICCHQMSDFEAKMNQIRFLLGSTPDPGEFIAQRSQTSELWLYIFKGLTL